MSRVARGGSAASSKRRRTPVKQQGVTARSVPWIWLAVVVGVVAVVGLVVYLVTQSEGGSSSGPSSAQALELDPAPGLPGEYVNLPVAFQDNGTNAGYHKAGAPDTASHVQQDVDYSGETSANSSTGLPPAGGPHWGSASCGEDPAAAPPYCGPAPWGIYRTEWPAETVVHNMEHGGVVIWYNSSDVAIRDQIESIATTYLEDGKYLVVMPYSNMPDNSVALTAWARRDLFPVSEFSADRVTQFIDAMMCRFNPENFPACGSM